MITSADRNWNLNHRRIRRQQSNGTKALQLYKTKMIKRRFLLAHDLRVFYFL